MPDEQNARRALRVAVSLRTGFRKQGNPASKAELLNISATGFAADCAMNIAQGDRVWLMLPGLEAKEAIVIWARDFHIGCEFVEPFADYVFESVAASLAKPDT